MQTILTPGQRSFFKWVIGLALFLLANSAYLFLTDGTRDLTVFYQLMLIAHLVGGTLLLVLATVFIVWHLGRVRKLLDRSSVSSGLTLTAAAYLLFVSGLYIFYEANSREFAWILVAHQVLAVLAPLAYGLHRLVGHFKPPRRRVLRACAVSLLLTGMLLAAHAVAKPETSSSVPVAQGSSAGGNPYGAKQTDGDLSDPFLPFLADNFPAASAPFFPSLATTSTGGFAKTHQIMRDETCKRCHPDVFAQWQASAHRHASLSNPFYLAAVESAREAVGRKASQWCAGCHDPALLFPGNFEKDFDLDDPAATAGLTCIACHAIDRRHGLAGNGNYNLDLSASPYVFDEADSGWRRYVADQMIKAKPGAHRRQFMKPFFRTPEYCMMCHKVSLDVPVNRYRYLRGQDEYDAWQNSGVSHGAARTFYLPAQPTRCQDCHMPPEAATRGDVSAHNGTVRSHRFLAVNNALPALRGDTEMLDKMERNLRGRMSIDVFAATFRDGSMVRALDAARPGLPPGEEVVVDVVVRNRRVGHTFPGGTNDSNQGWVHFLVFDGDRIVFQSGAMGKDRRVDKKAHFYRVVMVRHDGTEGTDRDAWNFHAAAFKRVVGPGTADVARYAFTVPADAKDLRIEARLMWRKFNRTYTEFVFNKLKRPVPELPVMTLATSAVTLPVGAKAATAVATPAIWMRYNDHGIANLLQGAFDVAEESFREVARLQPGRADGYRNQARRWIQSATPNRAVPLLKKVDEVAPSDAQRPYFWGRLFQRLEEFEKAEEMFEASLGVFARDRDVWRRLGEVRYKMQKYDASLQAFLNVLRIDPEDFQAHKRRLDIYRQLGREPEAAEAKKAFDKYKRDNESMAVARRFLLENPAVNHDAQPRHIHR